MILNIFLHGKSYDINLDQIPDRDLFDDGSISLCRVYRCKQCPLFEITSYRGATSCKYTLQFIRDTMKEMHIRPELFI